MHTPWGYEVDELPPLVGRDEFDAATGYKWDCNGGADAAIAAASAAIRNHCGWHVAPVLPCTAKLTARGRIAAIPAKMVTAIESVSDGGRVLTEGQYEARADGLLRRACFCHWTMKWEGVEVAYDAGFDPSAVPDVVQACIHLAEAALAAPAGVASESAGGVSVSYSTASASVAAAMTPAIRDALAPFRLVSSHAA